VDLGPLLLELLEHIRRQSADDAALVERGDDNEGAAAQQRLQVLVRWNRSQIAHRIAKRLSEQVNEFPHQRQARGRELLEATGHGPPYRRVAIIDTRS